MTSVNGGLFPSIRPQEFERPDGFSIVLSRSPRAIFAAFEPDNFARPLLDQIQDAFDRDDSPVDALLGDLVSAHQGLVISVNGQRISGQADLPEADWDAFAVECEQILPKVHRSGPELIECAVEVSGVVLAVILAGLPVEEVDGGLSDEVGLPEGARAVVTVNRYERSPANRAACIAYYGVVCQACGLRFSDRYGDLGGDFIHVHHRVPVAAMGPGYVVHPTKDLVPVCPNCHAMLHRRTPPLDVTTLKAILDAGGR